MSDNMDSPPSVVEFFDTDKMKRKGNRAGVASAVGLLVYFLVHWVIELASTAWPDLGKMLDASWAEWLAQAASAAVAAYVAKLTFQIQNKAAHKDLPKPETK